MQKTAGLGGVSGLLSVRLFGKDFDALRSRTVVVFLNRLFFPENDRIRLRFRFRVFVPRAVRRFSSDISIELLPRG